MNVQIVEHILARLQNIFFQNGEILLTHVKRTEMTTLGRGPTFKRRMNDGEKSVLDESQLSIGEHFFFGSQHVEGGQHVTVSFRHVL
jgi:hypothetical protein